MEKKTIGSFITALRKANGMTQKDLAEKLNVSDKTISRWERDDGTPDLSVIPVIAEIFGVTCDELLRGERYSPAERIRENDGNELTAKGEKQRQRLLKSTLSRYRAQTYIAIGISIVGVIVAIICNLMFSNDILCYMIGAIFLIISVICQAFFLTHAFSSVEGAELDEKDLFKFRKNAITLAEKAIGVIVAIVSFTLPLIIGRVTGRFRMSIVHVIIYGVLLLILYAVICHFLNAFLVRKGLYKNSI